MCGYAYTHTHTDLFKRRWVNTLSQGKFKKHKKNQDIDFVNNNKKYGQMVDL